MSAPDPREHDRRAWVLQVARGTAFVAVSATDHSPRRAAAIPAGVTGTVHRPFVQFDYGILTEAPLRTLAREWLRLRDREFRDLCRRTFATAVDPAHELPFFNGNESIARS